MKKLLAMLLSLVMLLALVPTAFAEDADYTLVIAGGDVNENLVTYEGKSCLEVPVTVNSTVADEQLIALTFQVNFDTAQLTYAGVEKEDVFNSFIVNDTVEGQLRLAITAEGFAVTKETAVAKLYFEVAEDLEAGTEIAFTLADGAIAETLAADNTGKTYDLTADFKPFTVSDAGPEFTGTVEFAEGAVQYKGATPYVIWDHDAGKHEPAFIVKDEDGKTVDPANYDYEYKENTYPGTGYLFVYFKGAYSGEAMLSFKIYLPATTTTTVENLANGIKVTWAPVKDAAGYVIYRRAWSSSTGGWTAFARWNNTTSTTYIDGADANHKVYAGTRYQYGVKAYFTRRLDPIAGSEIGGNVNEPSGNYNLGEVGPLKTIVRITTRKLSKVTPGKKQLTAAWDITQVFTGYQVQVATDKNFTKNVKTTKITAPKTGETTIKSLTTGTTYYVRVRSYQDFNGVTYYGQWSNVLSGKVK